MSETIPVSGIDISMEYYSPIELQFIALRVIHPSI
jgi:hypothetical protein